MPYRLLVALIVLLTSRADAAMMEHYDLAGLLLQADSVVVADRIGVIGELTQYRVVRSLRGTRKPGEPLELQDRYYNTSGHTLDARVVVFLRTSDNKPWVVPSGLRVFEGGKAFRFEQHDNPGPYVMVAQGQDPQDQWKDVPQLDLAGLERAIADAQKRVETLAAAKSITDSAKRRATVLSLFPPPGGSGGGFYVDLLAGQARVLLADAGDLEGSLLVDMRDRGMTHRARGFAKLADLVAIAKDPTRPTDVRITALEVATRGFDLASDFAALAAITTMIDDADPDLRAAAMAAAAEPAGTMTSDRAEQRKIDAWVAKIRNAIAKRYITEQDPRVIAAILAIYERSFRKPAPPRANGPRAVAIASATEGYLGAEVYCARPTKVDSADFVIRKGTTRVPTGSFSISVNCAESSSTAGGIGGPPAGTYDLGIELTLKGGGKLALPIGKLVVEPNGERRITR